jgi:hypothetical protein
MEVDASTATSNTYEENIYIGGTISGRTAGGTETVSATLDPTWFPNFPTALNHDATTLRPAAGTSWLNGAPQVPSATVDRDGAARANPTDPGPWEVP